MTTIHPTAIVDPGAELGDDVEIGPLCYVGAGVRLGDKCRLLPRVTLLGPAEFGRGNVFYPGAVLGAAPQDLKYRGGPTGLIVGDDNVFRELVTVHRGTEVDMVSGGMTRVGSRSLFMVGVHIAHDCDLGDSVIIANGVQMAGHVKIEDGVVVGGLSAMHHFCTIGHYAYVGGTTRITSDVPPYMKVAGYNQAVRSVNIEGMRRWRLPHPSIRAVKQAARLMFGRRSAAAMTVSDAYRRIEEDGLMIDEHVRYLVEFMQRKVQAGVHGRHRERMRSDTDADRAKFYAKGGQDGE